MTDRLDSFRDLPPELAELDAELSSIRYEERPSFAPELEADLAREWQSVQGRRYWPVRQLIAACVAALLMVGLGVPSARAALIRMVESFTASVEEVVTPPPAPGLLQAPPVEDTGIPPAGGESAPTGQLSGVSTSPPPVRDPVAQYDGPEATFPELLDRNDAEALIRRHYPASFQEAGIGGTVVLLLWVDSTGVVDFVNLGQSSGVPELDWAALRVAPSFQFEPARRRGRAVGTWVEFDVRFEAQPTDGESGWLPDVKPVEQPQAAVDLSHPELGSEWRQGTGLVAPNRRLSAPDYLRAALGGAGDVARLEPMEAILNGNPPPGRSPTAWRTEVGRALEEAMARAPDNPAPFLALARIRLNQGMRTEARVLLERGLQRAQRNPAPVAPSILADLQYERGLLVKENWLASRDLGRLRADALPAAACPQARSSGGAVSGYASVERIIAWNYLCPERLGDILDRDFESLEARGATDEAVTQASFRAAVEAEAGHPEANLEILLGLAEEGRWNDLLSGAMRFLAISGGDAHGALLAGMALQRLSRSEEAEASFSAAIAALSPDEAQQIQDIAPLLLPSQATEYRRLSQADQEAWRASFWSSLDPILATPVNERKVEHLARTAYALLRFGSTRADPSEVWIRYGQPDRVRAFDGGGGVRTELWDFGPGPDLTFRRLATSQLLDLTPEGRAYLDEVREMLPHRYGTASRLVFPLPVQVARFRSGDETRVEMTVRVPQTLATGSGDRLDVSLVLLGSGGDTLAVAREDVSALEQELSFSVPASREVAGVVAEVYSPRTGQAAALRDSLAPLSAASGASMSDVLLTDVASPTAGQVQDREGWMVPLDLSEPVGSHAIGAYVEMYDVGRISRWYRLRAELEDLGTGDVRELPVQPAGETGFRASWDRRAARGSVTREFLSIWLGDVDPGRYRVRIVAEVPEAGVPLVAEQILNRR